MKAVPGIRSTLNKDVERETGEWAAGELWEMDSMLIASWRREFGYKERSPER